MKKKLLFILSVLFLGQSLSAQVVTIPDAAFKSYLVADLAINTNKDTEIQVSEAAAFTGSIQVSSKNIKSLVGIESFIKLTTLNCSTNSLTSLDLSKNIQLLELNCIFNELTNLSLDKNVQLTQINCSFNNLVSLDVTKNTSLITLGCSGNKIVNLDVSKNIQLVTLSCSGNNITNLDVSKNTQLSTFYCNVNQLTSLDVSKNVQLANLDFSDNNITNLDLSKNTKLIEFGCSGNKLISLDVSKNSNLTKFNCLNNELKNLDISKNIQLISLNCSSNKLLTGLNLKNGKNTLLTSLFANNNPALKCIEVDDASKIPTSWKKDATASYSTKCNVSAEDLAFTNSLNLYPNPATNNFFVKWDGAIQNVNIELFNSQGTLVKSQNIDNQGSISVEDLPKGLYFCQIKDEKKVLHISKIILE